MPRRVILLGATGSIGTSVLSVLRECRDEFTLAGLAARRAGEALAALADEFPDAAVASVEPGAAGGAGVRHAGPDAAVRLVRETEADVCVAAMPGTAGLGPAFAAAARGMRILLANKEVLVSAGRLFMDAAKAGGSEVLPLDSEHAALWQCLDGRKPAEVDRLFITASGGPFREWPPERMRAATPAEALRHPVWRMGAKISIDSATLANKALEVIEAHHLFGVDFDRIEVLVHPQSAVHGMAEMTDGSILASLGAADMRQAVGYMLRYPERRPGRFPRLDLAGLARLDFAGPDHARFPLLRLGVEAGKRGGRAAARFNAANEAAVELFLARRIPFTGIAMLVADAMRTAAGGDPGSLEEVEAIHLDAGRAVREGVSARDAVVNAIPGGNSRMEGGA